jgi:hypothetical protein
MYVQNDCRNAQVEAHVYTNVDVCMYKCGCMYVQPWMHVGVYAYMYSCGCMYTYSVVAGQPLNQQCHLRRAAALGLL